MAYPSAVVPVMPLKYFWCAIYIYCLLFGRGKLSIVYEPSGVLYESQEDEKCVSDRSYIKAVLGWPNRPRG
jgi:hypothetical protein